MDLKGFQNWIYVLIFYSIKIFWLNLKFVSNYKDSFDQDGVACRKFWVEKGSAFLLICL